MWGLCLSLYASEISVFHFFYSVCWIDVKISKNTDLKLSIKAFRIIERVSVIRNIFVLSVHNLNCMYKCEVEV